MTFGQCPKNCLLERNLCANSLEFSCSYSHGTVLRTSCAPEPKNGDTTKDSGAKSSDSTVTDLDTDELTQDDILQIVFSFDGVDYFNQWWTDETYSRTEKINENAQPSGVLLYMDLTDYTAGTGLGQ